MKTGNGNGTTSTSKNVMPQQILNGKDLEELWHELNDGKGGFARTFMCLFRNIILNPLYKKEVNAADVVVLNEMLERADSSITCFTAGIAEMGSMIDANGDHVEVRQDFGYFLSEIAHILRELSLIQYDIAHILREEIQRPQSEKGGQS